MCLGYWYEETSGFARFRGCPKWYALLERITLYSFSLYEFSHGIFSVKVFNVAMLTQVYVSISSFPHGDFYGNTEDIDYSIKLVELME